MAHQTVQNPNTALIRAQNARSIARRASVSALAQSVSRTNFASLTRNPRRQIGGRFEEIIDEPDPITLPDAKVPDDLINQFFSALNFASRQTSAGRRNVVVANEDTAPRPAFGRGARAIAGRRGTRFGRPSVFNRRFGGR